MIKNNRVRLYKGFHPNYKNYLAKIKKITIESKEYNGVWVSGYYYMHAKENICVSEDDYEGRLEHYICEDDLADWGFEPQIQKWRIVPKTLSECTGARDRNNYLIYENDIVRFLSEDNEECFGYVKYSEIRACYLVMYDGIGFPFDAFTSLKGNYSSNLEVVGNIFENAELISKPKIPEEIIKKIK